MRKFVISSLTAAGILGLSVPAHAAAVVPDGVYSPTGNIASMPVQLASLQREVRVLKSQISALQMQAPGNAVQADIGLECVATGG